MAVKGIMRVASMSLSNMLVVTGLSSTRLWTWLCSCGPCGPWYAGVLWVVVVGSRTGVTDWVVTGWGHWWFMLEWGTVGTLDARSVESSCLVPAPRPGSPEVALQPWSFLLLSSAPPLLLLNQCSLAPIFFLFLATSWLSCLLFSLGPPSSSVLTCSSL